MASSIRIGVVVFPGSNCDQDMVDALSVYPQVEVVKLWHKSSDLQNVHMVVLPGGFSYGDYLRSGAIARFSPIMNEVIRFASSGGYVLGVCNGFQILCESHLLPGALLHNNSHSFICENVFLKTGSSASPMTKSLASADVFQIPIAHGEGKYFTDADSLKKLQDTGQILFRYCSKDGVLANEFNPNGAIDHIAGICNDKMNVFGMMPHPERAANPTLGNTDGRIILNGFLQELFSEVLEPDYNVSI
jgi:phosphoribosylformylglycinamidine synthase